MKPFLNKKRITSAMTLLMACVVAISSADPAYAKKKKEEEEKPFIEAQKIAPKSLDTMTERKYDEGIMIKRVEIEGNNLVNDSMIRSILEAKEGSKFDKNLIKEDLKKIYEMGYFTDHIKAVPRVSPTGVTLKIKVEENVPITGFNITGNEVVETQELAEIFDKQTGLPQNIGELNKSIKALEDLYAQKGYILARVKEISDDPDGMINVRINEGTLDEVKISGNTKTKDFVVKRNLVVEPGMVYNENILKQDLSRLYNTQAFGDVRRVITPSENNPEKYCLTVEVDEKRTGTISMGGGIDTSTGLFGTLGYTDRNFRGLGQQLSLNFTSGSGMLLHDRDTLRRTDFQFEARFLEPRFRQTMNSLELTAFGRDFASFQIPLAIERRIGGEIEVARPLKSIPNLAGSVSMGVEYIGVREGDQSNITQIFNEAGVDIAKRAEQLVSATYITLGPSLVYDTRDTVINTRDGSYASIKFKQSLALEGNSDSFGTVTASIRRFIPIGHKSSFTVGGKVGGGVWGSMPEFSAFRVGGARSVRGYREGNIGNGEGFYMASAELRTPIPLLDRVTDSSFLNNLRLAYFLDAGSTFRSTLTDQLYNRPGYGISTGLGLRVMIPGLGPMNLDYGIPITNVGAGNKKGGRFTFSFGELY